ncbi:hypothetical protein KP77_25500 [Jeotgalibacillus alimentarius]|uniref:Antirepressor n=1 Tax=Jeotgalibacillus alimentarius TaxID=135826 RepID=A0A0C2VRA9_9BACL|nr:ORF6N domain-containing protein [Jeotgalibacillus alimentarius]KIL46981.1 hypothetical protein KP77_25500 [Jeotgalibacillus alimentarius]
MNSIQPITFNDQRLLTTQQMAEAYGTDTDRVTKNYNRNIERYLQNKHYILLHGEELKAFRAKGQIALSPNINRLYLWTEKGAWLHAKSLNTDQAWEAYEMLVDEYYRVQETVKVLSEREQLEASMKLSLMTSQDVQQLKGDVIEIKSMVENQITLDHGEQRRLQKGVAQRVYSLTSCEKERRRLFRELYREIKDRFAVASYKDVKRKDLLTAINYIDNWIPRQVS